MASFSKFDVILVRFPFSDLSGSKVRPAVVVHGPHPSQDVIAVPLTSRVSGLLPGEFSVLSWKAAGLNVPTAVKRGLFTLHSSLIVKRVGCFDRSDAKQLDQALRAWLLLV